jgi:hypothetical protein
MKDNADKKSRSKPLETKVAAKAGVMALRAPGKAVQVRHLDAPPKVKRPKVIHERRRPPLVREGVERPFHSLNARAIIHKVEAAGQDIKIVLNTPLTEPAQNDVSGTVGEPSCSINGDVVFVTGNWYAAVSVDGGKTFKFIDPNQMAQPTDPAGVTFCCDQVVNYIPSIDTFVWLLQYGPRTGDNIQRIAYAKTDDVKAGRWRTFDITTQALGAQGAFLDFPDLAVGANFLYMTTNIFPPNNGGAGTAVVRIPFDSIAAGNPTAEKFVSMDLFSFRVAQNCRDTAYFAAHRDTSKLAVFSWPENQAQPVASDVEVARWIGTNGYFSRTPDGRRWLDRADPRLTGATLAGNELWFAWGVDANSNHRPQPFVQMARLNNADLSLIENVNLFDSDSAICYAGLATNANNEVGVSYMIGGAVFPSHVVGLLSNDRKSLVAGAGDRGPLPSQDGSGEWGDFLTARPVYPERKLFAGAGYSLLGQQDGDNQDATPRFVIFGRAADIGGAGAGGGGAAGGAGGEAGGGSGGNGGGPVDTGGAGRGPISDVNKLTTVSSAVAKQIKDACGVHTGASAAMQAAFVPMPAMVTSPGTERWKVKTGQDDDRNLVGKNIINGKNLGAGVVEATVTELIGIPRPPGFENIKGDPPAQFSHKRSQPVETTIWRVEGKITVVKQEKDGDYHIVLQGPTGDTLVAEIPTPTKEFVGDSPWLQNISEARKAVDDKLISQLNPHDFVLEPGGTTLVPRNALSGDYPLPMANFRMPESFTTPAEGQEAQMPAFKTSVTPTPARITGIGFFDRWHGQTGVAPNVFELHTVLKIEWM